MGKHAAHRSDPLASTESEPGKHMAEFDMKYQVGITFCNTDPSGKPFALTHVHQNPKDAIYEYGEMLTEAFTPIAKAVHVRMVSFFVIDQFDQVHRHIDSGVFPCEHNPSGGNSD